MTLLICPVRPGESNEELRYALRSWETNLVMPNLYLLIVGDKPSWLEPDWFVSGNHFENPQANIFANVKQGAGRALDLGFEEVIFMNDDFFCVDPVPGVVPVRRDMTLAEHVNLYPQYREMWWPRSLALTASWLAERGFPRPWSYEVHRPLFCAPERMLSALSQWEGGLGGDIPQWRTMYGVLNNVDAHPVPDVKVGLPGTTPYTAWVSTSDESWHRYGLALMRRFAKPSRWER